MAPLRRYLRITKHSVLEVRIYLDRPSDQDRWLLKRDNPALPRVIQAVRPLVLPKLREENEQAKGKGSKARKKGVKDVVIEDDFEVSIFLTELSSRHTVLTKQKTFEDKPRIQSNSAKLTNWLTTGTNDRPVVISGDNNDQIILRDDGEDEPINLADIPEAGAIEEKPKTRTSGRSKRRRPNQNANAVEISSDSDDSLHFEEDVPPSKRSKSGKRGFRADESGDDAEAGQDDKKKLGLNTSYDGFSIYGRILCLVVKRKGRTAAGPGGVPASSQQMLEDWVSTQAAAEQVGDDDEHG